MASKVEGAKMRMVERAEWDLSRMPEERRNRLLDPPSPGELLLTVHREAMEATPEGRGLIEWQLGRDDGDMVGCGRAIVVLPLRPATFDALFNGRSGYRAQYYLSCAEGADFNRQLVLSLIEPARIVYRSKPLQEPWTLLQHSLQGPWSKIWVHGDAKPFEDAPTDEFRPGRWVERDHSVSAWLRAPLPDRPAIDLKGTWVSAATNEYRQDAVWKGDRDCRLHERGHA
jgi:hypothetical protein